MKFLFYATYAWGLAFGITYLHFDSSLVTPILNRFSKSGDQLPEFAYTDVPIGVAIFISVLLFIWTMRRTRNLQKDLDKMSINDEVQEQQTRMDEEKDK